MAFLNSLKEFFNKEKSENEPEKEYEVHRPSVHTSVFVLLYFFLLLLFALLWDQSFPTVVMDSSQFKAEDIQLFNKELVKIGPRVVGSKQNEIDAVELLTNKIQQIIRSKHPDQNIEFQKQIVSGGYFLGFPYNSINIYKNVVNLIVKVHSGTNSNRTLLINAHFDSVPESPGGSDDGIMCAVMIEILKVISKTGKKPRHNIVFLFNGAEETALQASHGFITQHEWAENIVALINLEATGWGGKEMLFQTGPKQPWLLKYYAKVPYPHGQVAGEEVFQSNMIPSDTDFRVFRDFGDIIGYDLAYTRNGYRYHTKYDNDEIRLAVYQHTGENILTLVNEVANAEELEDDKNLGEGDEKPVFFDFMGLFFVHYNRSVELAVNLITTIVSILCFAKYIYDFKIYKTLGDLKYVMITFGAQILGFIVSAGVVLLIGVILDAANFAMRWYTSVWLILGLYCAPVFGINLLGTVLLNKYNKPEKFTYGMQSQFQLQSINLIWTLLVFIGTLAGIRSVYALLIPIMFITIGVLIIQIFKLQLRSTWMYIYLAALLIPTLFIFQLALEILLLYVPIQGRSGDSTNPELFIALNCFLLTTLSTCYYVPIFTFARRAEYILYFIFAVFGLFFILTFTPVTFPYGIKNIIAPHRYSIFHTERIFKNEMGEITQQDYGFTFTNTDRNSPWTIEDEVDEMKDSRLLEGDCDLALYCGVATTNSRSLANLEKGIWIPTEPPAENSPKLLYSLKSKIKTGNQVDYIFEISGPSRMNIYFAIPKEVTFKETNLMDDIPSSDLEWKGKTVYYVLYAHGTKPNEPWNVHLSFQVPGGIPEKFLDFAVAGKYTHDVVISEEYETFLEQFPEWVALASWVAKYESGVY